MPAEGPAASATVCVVVVNQAGLGVARRLRRALAAAWPEPRETEIHAPRALAAAAETPFAGRSAAVIAERFAAGRPLVLVMAAGIAVRALSGLPRSKHQDPPVVLLDTAGRQAISLLSGHEGGANALAVEVANALDAEPIITTGTEAARPCALGLGCRRGAAAAAVTEAIGRALEAAAEPLTSVRWAATVDAKRDEAGLRSALAELGLPLRLFPAAAIRRVEALFAETAARRHLGVGSVAEPCAFLALPRGRLILPRQTIGPVTVAVAKEDACCAS